MTRPAGPPVAWRLAADRGGTFTDCIALDPEGAASRCKVLSSGRLRTTVAASPDERAIVPATTWPVPDDFFTGWQIAIDGRAAGRVVASGAGRLGTEHVIGVNAGAILELWTGEPAPVIGARLLTGTALGGKFPPLEFRIATTLATNALLEGTCARPVLFVTAGFPDLLVIGDQRRADLFALGHHREPPLTAAVCEVPERLDATGQVVHPLDEAALAAAAASLVRQGHRTAAVALAHSDLNPAHEQAVARILTAAGFDSVSLSSKLAPVVRLLPRAQTAVIDAALAPVMSRFTQEVRCAMGPEAQLFFVTSAGGMVPAEFFRPCDSLLSGPAGGVAGCAALATSCGEPRILTLDMGGTSTDVARHEDEPLYQFEQRHGRSVILAPALRIETVAAGGGSICDVTAEGLTVGPRSAGADPGPACYGRGGPLTLTDVNLLLGRLDPARAAIPLDPTPARVRLTELRARMAAFGHADPDDDRSLLEGLLAIAVARMAEAVRRISVRDGCDPAGTTLVAFGGAGPQHACAVADQLGIRRLLVSRDAGLLSARGALHAAREAFAVRQILRPLTKMSDAMATCLSALDADALTSLGAPGSITRRLAEVRLKGQESALTVTFTAPEEIAPAFAAAYRYLYGTSPPPGRAIELVSLRSVAATPTESPATESFPDTSPPVTGPAIIQDGFSTLVVEPGWQALQGDSGTWRLDRLADAAAEPPPAALTELFAARFQGIADAMGELLRRTAISANVKERMDFSCALLDPHGRLVVNAPHIPVHLGALGECVRRVCERLTPRPGDVFLTNDPACGGSHLPDVTVILPVFDDDGRLAGFTANRAHHAEIGGITPGSMPPAAACLAEEGVVIPPLRLAADDIDSPDGPAAALLTGHPWPTRALPDNLADLRAQVAAAQHGAAALADLCRRHGTDAVIARMGAITAMAAEAVRRRLAPLPPDASWRAVDTMDDGTPLAVSLTMSGGRLVVDFTGSGPVHPGNRNATPAIVRSALLYVLRLWIDEPLPLNEGLLDAVDLVLPEGLLNPPFDPDPRRSPAVVGGNVETSQRVVSLLIRALGLEADSQGTMNNVIFGDATFGHYETIGGGTGAGPNHDGLSGVHSHMTNTAITDLEVLERRFPVRVECFRLRPDSGGAGRFRGGDGIRRAWRFLTPVTLSLITEHRRLGPPGAAGGQPGLPGRQWLEHPDASTTPLPGTVRCEVAAGDVLVMETPGGGGWGA